MIKKEVGNIACQITKLLDSRGELAIKEISLILKHKEESVCIALGWLAREGKIFFFKEGDGTLKVCPMPSRINLKNEK